MRHLIIIRVFTIHIIKVRIFYDKKWSVNQTPPYMTNGLFWLARQRKWAHYHILTFLKHKWKFSSVSILYEPPHDKTNKMAYAPSEDSEQPGHLPSLIRVFAVRMKKAWVLSYSLSTQRRLWSDWVDAQADLSLRWAHDHFVCFVMRRLICCF